MKDIFFGFSSVLLALAPSVLAQCYGNNNTFSPILYDGPSQVQFTSCPSQAGGPRVSPINATTFDWWYFDAVSHDGTQALTVIFFTSSFVGFSFDVASVIDPLNIWIFSNFGDGLPAVNLPVAATSVTILTDENGASGNWTGSGISFVGTPDLSTYEINFDSPIAGLSGSMTLNSRGPGHYYCGPLESGVDEQVLPNIGWANVIPGADATVDVTILGQKLMFTGNGYHDKNWGDTPFTSALQSWYWDHATIGGYNLVFFNMIDSTGVNKVGGYALKDGEVVGSTCTTGVKIRPVGTPYTPTILTAVPTALTLNMTLNDGSVLNAALTEKETQTNIGLYIRWIGTIEATVDGATESGTGMWEQFAVTF